MTETPALTLDYIPPADLHLIWPRVREGLDEVVRRAPAHWIPEDVYHALRANAATLHIATDSSDGEYLGFMVLMRVDMWDGPTLHVWAAHSQGEHDVLVNGVEPLKALARSIQARRVVFSSQRKGWEKKGEVIGFKPTTTSFELEV